ncbi:CgeB family protein [Fictibacillus fluitans]|uniref:Glycosyltransferase n=1 Tax=Fictibacillus fluitans TaxID=3058422 RepID=A0ABT8HS68_9BACL|nr:glycosyltransferase [Fictibacillus sp. NE201]MDN4523617.1 glycosyltransferase [Fictibacillus sp. NE201]
MKILYITSGFPGIYDYFDHWIVNACKVNNVHCKLFNLYEGLPRLKFVFQRFQPDLVLTMTGFVLSKEMTDWLGKRHVPLAVWMTEDPYYMDLTLPIIERYDFIFTIDTAAQKVYEQNGHKLVFPLPLGTEPSVFKAATEQDAVQERDICLVGFPYPDRIELIKYLLDNTDYTITVVGGRWRDDLSQHNENTKLTIIDWSTPLEVAEYYRQSKIILNTNRPHNYSENKNSIGVINQSVNNRTFDIAATCGFQLLSYKKGISDIFTDEEIVTFESKEDLLEKIRYYMEDETKRKAMACKAQEKVLKNHTFSNRIQQLVKITRYTPVARFSQSLFDQSSLFTK